MRRKHIPTPGSDEAIKMGCTCPVMDNAHGKGFIWDNELCFIYNADCPVHSEEYFSYHEENQGEIDFNVLD